MKKTISFLQCSLLVAAVTLTIVGLFPSEASALKSCEFYCGPAGPDSCVVTPTFICPYTLN